MVELFPSIIDIDAMLAKENVYPISNRFSNGFLQFPTATMNAGQSFAFHKS
jgi:hypothetical protein